MTVSESRGSAESGIGPQPGDAATEEARLRDDIVKARDNRSDADRTPVTEVDFKVRAKEKAARVAKKVTAQGHRVVQAAREKTSNGRQQAQTKVGQLPGGLWEDASARGQTHPARRGAAAAIAGMGATTAWMRRRRSARKQSRWGPVMKVGRQMRAKARDASMRARESASAAQSAPAARRGRMATVAAGAVVAMAWLRRRRNAGGRSGRSR